MKITQTLLSMGDEKYAKFTASLIPGAKNFIGIKLPVLRKLAKEYCKDEESRQFMQQLPHCYFEENMLQCFLIGEIRDFDQCIQQLERFLPYVDNWAVCDTINPKVFTKNRERLLPYIDKWMASDHLYTVRCAIGLLMRHYLNEDFRTEQNDKVAALRSDEYYLNMMIAWYFATALAKQWDATIGYIEDQKLDRWTHNKTIQKAIESFRVSDEHKEYLKTLRNKKK